MKKDNTYQLEQDIKKMGMNSIEEEAFRKWLEERQPTPGKKVKVLSGKDYAQIRLEPMDSEKLLAEIQKLENDNGVLQRRLQEVTAENAKKGYLRKRI